jgi:lysophospholipase L1-like esterase
MTHPAIALGLLAGALAAPPMPAEGPGDRPPLTLRDGDRVVLVGDALIERMQDSGHLETLLTAAHPDKAITFRNLGWSGDTVFGEARAGFGTPEDGFKELVAQVKAAEPTVLVVGYGANESWAGDAGLPRFRDGYNRLLDELEATGAREIILLSPIPHGTSGRFQFEGGPHNADVRRYADEIGAIAEARGHRFIDVDAAIRSYPTVSLEDIEAGKRPPPNLGHATYAADGIHLDEPGQDSLASWLASRLFDVHGWVPTAGITAGDEIAVRAAHCTISDATAWPDGLRFRFTRSTLVVSPGEAPGPSQGSIRVEGLPEGRYRVRCDGEPLPRGHGGVRLSRVQIDDWFSYAIADGATSVGLTVVPGALFVDTGPDLEQFEQLRQAITAKNRLYFHRYRPQNSTYLFGFRKHEQGNNAVEVEEFARLVAEAEAEIARLKVPRPHLYELERIDEEDADR